MSARRFEIGSSPIALFAALFVLGCGGSTEGNVASTDTHGDAGPGSSGGAIGAGGTRGGTGGRPIGVDGGSGEATGGAGPLGTGGASSGITSGLPPNETGSQLTAGDLQNLCAAELAYLKSRISDQDLTNLGCFLLAVASSGGATPTVSDCKTSFSDCIANAGPGTSMTNCTVDQSKLAGCTATVAELEACMSAGIDQTAATLPKLDCDIFALSQSEIQTRLGALNQIPPACGPVQQKCPSALPSQ